MATEADGVLIIVGDATETVDTLYPFLRVQEEGFRPVVAGPERRRYQMVLHEIPQSGWEITREYEGYTIQAEVAFADVRPEDYVGLFFSGGRAPEYIRYDPDLVRITRHFFAHDKPVASVCHGVEIPAYAGVVEGQDDGMRAQVPVRPGGVRRDLLGGAVGGRRQPGVRPHVARPRPLHAALDGPAARRAHAHGGGGMSSPMKLGYGTYAMQKLDVYEALPRLRALGYESVEIMGEEGWATAPDLMDREDRKRLAGTIRDLGLDLSAVMALLPLAEEGAGPAGDAGAVPGHLRPGP